MLSAQQSQDGRGVVIVHRFILPSGRPAVTRALGNDEPRGAPDDPSQFVRDNWSDS